MSTESRAVRSMTGFAAERAQTSAGELSVSLRSVNHRGLDIHFHGGSEFAVFENEVRSLLKSHIARGHVEVRFSLQRSAAQTPILLNRNILDAYLAIFRQAAKEQRLASEPDLNLLLGLRGVLEDAPAAQRGPDAEFLPELIAVLTGCVVELNRHREREGAELSDEMSREAAEIESAATEIARLRGEILPHFQGRIREKLAELLVDAGISESRVLEEAALLADRSDIQEEIVRLGVHVAELKRILAEGGEVGKRLDFLLQEMNREANTTLAKSANAGEAGLGITALGLHIKANIERIREQALNLE